MKTGVYPEDVVLAWCARKYGMPLKWRADRIEEFLAATHGRDVTSKAELALDGDGRVLALRVDSLANVGAYATPAGVVIQLLIGPWVSTSIYDIGTIDIRIRAVLTNTAPTGAYRGAGRPEAIYIIERLMDAAARQTGIDPVELRRRNMIRPEQMPYRNADGQDLRQRAVRAGARPGDRARRLAGFRRAGRRFAAARPAARPRHGGVSRMDRRRRVRGARDGHRRRIDAGRRHDRDLLGDAGDGTGPRDDVTRSSRSTCSACRSRRSASCRATPTAAPASAAPARARSSSAARR